MSNSPLVEYKRISPNSSNPRKSKIKKITIHHVAGKISLKTLGNIFAPKSRKASSNYGVDNEGRIGMYVEEKNRAWTSGNAKNDHESVTIEVVNSRTGGNWPVSDKALEGTINLCVDICKRNGIKKLSYTGDSRGNLTRHNMFQNTNCPGPYLQSKFPYIASEVNKRLGYKSEQITIGQITLPKRGYFNKGDRAGSVKIIQKYLKELGFDVGRYGIDGVYGNDTIKAVRQFQKKYKLKIDGSVGQEVAKKFEEIFNKPQKGINRVYIDGKKVGSFSEEKNIINQVKQNLNKADKIEIIKK